MYIFLEKDGKFLIARRKNTGYEDGNYSVPAGHVEEGELPTETMVREAREEIGIDIAPSDIVVAHVVYRTKQNETGDRIDIFFHARTWSGEVKNMEPEKCDDLKWVELDNLPVNMIAYVRDAFMCVRKGIFFKEIGADFYK